ncbi:MAG: 6-phosphofructokinase, partial [Flavobacteriaceae bacterium]|nr:6-phosphofructokinase [Flavobacteriaceae bacterium]
MKDQPKRIAVLTSGGDAPGMNAALRAVVRASVFYGAECYAVHQGYQGLIDNEFELMNARSVKNIINKGGTIIKSARCLEFRTPEGRKQAYENIKKSEIDALVVIGGDGSFTGAMIFQEEFDFPVIGIPGTIDNDIFGTRYTLGYDT